MAELGQQEIEAYLGEPHVANLTTVRPGGRPHVAPVWFLWEAGRVYMIAGNTAVKVRNIRANPAVALSVAADARPYQYVIMEGQAQVREDGLEDMVNRICIRYDGPDRGAEFAQELLSSGGTVLLEVDVTKTLSWQEDD